MTEQVVSLLIALTALGWVIGVWSTQRSRILSMARWAWVYRSHALRLHQAMVASGQSTWPLPLPDEPDWLRLFEDHGNSEEAAAALPGALRRWNR
jgi:hypothetical protein